MEANTDFVCHSWGRSVKPLCLPEREYTREAEMREAPTGRHVKLLLVLAGVGILCSAGRSQDSVDVTFRYVSTSVSSVTLPGEFNGWSNTAWPMTNQGNGLWTRTARLRIGGNPAVPPPIAGAWQYKFYYPGASPWPNDPLNHHVNTSDNDNSYLYVRDPTIYQFVPNQRNPLVTTGTPTISAYLFPKVGSRVDTGTIALIIDGVTYSNLGTAYDSSSQLFSFHPATPLPNGDHVVILEAGLSADTVHFTTLSGFVQITNRGGFSTVNPLRTLRGTVQDTMLTLVRIVHDGTDTSLIPIVGGRFSAVVSLTEGANTYLAIADSAGTPVSSSPVTFTLVVDHRPFGRATATSVGPNLLLNASGTTDPDGQTVTNFAWLDDPATPLGLSGRTGVSVMLAKLAVPGEYYYGLIATDPDGHADTSRQYFTITQDHNVVAPTIASNPRWAKEARVYFLFPKAITSQGTLAAASQHLQRIRDLGFSVVWVMPVMRNAYPIDNNYGPGYNIVDFDNVAPEYGTNQDFHDFVAQAHALGLKVILDVTPNHTSRFHPWAADARTFGEDSRYWSWYEHTMIPHNTNGLGQSLDAYGFNYYSAFSDQLLNFNWNDPDARAEMIRVYTSWIQNYGIDGYRFDVYWGPDRRYGEQVFGKPIRDALKHIKPDILLLAEDDGTGAGTEQIYADHSNYGINGGVDAAYDFKLYFNQIEGFGFSSGAVTSLDNEILNGGFYPGPNSLYMRFMESQDEDRIVYFYSNNFAIDSVTTYRRTMPMASVIFTAPGFPMLWNGQEVGWGYGITGAKEARSRSVINWNNPGKDLLSPHYQKLAHIRGEFPPFTWHKQDSNGDGAITSADSSDFVRLTTSNGAVYAFARPYTDQNGMTVANFTGADVTVSVDATGAGGLKFSGGIKPSALYYVNNLTENSRQQIPGSALNAIAVSLPPYGSSVFTISTTADTLKIANPIVAVAEESTTPKAYALEQNYPNPFNPTTVVSYQLPAVSGVRLCVYDLLGREVRVLVNERQGAGVYQVRFDGTGLSSGVYLCRLTATGFSMTRKMVLVR
jgi:glycosidase